MTRAAFLAIAFLVSGCAGQAETYQVPPALLSPMHDATVQAGRDCGGPYVAWSRVTSRSLFPLRTEVSETMRCLRDGRVVGPYTYLVDAP